MTLNLLNLPDEMLVKILSLAFPKLVIGMEWHQIFWGLPKPVPPPWSVSHGFTRMLTPIALEKLHFLPHEVDKLLAVSNYLGQEAYGCHGDGPRIKYVREFVLDREIEKFTSLNVSKFAHLFKEAVNLEKFSFQSRVLSLATSDISVFDAPKLSQLQIVHNGTFPATFYAPLARPDVLPSLKHLSIHIYEVESLPRYYEGLAEGLHRLDSLHLSDGCLRESHFTTILAPHLGGLRWLNLNLFPFDRMLGICEAIATHCSSLQSLTITRPLSDVCLRQLFEDVNGNKEWHKTDGCSKSGNDDNTANGPRQSSRVPSEGIHLPMTLAELNNHDNGSSKSSCSNLDEGGRSAIGCSKEGNSFRTSIENLRLIIYPGTSIAVLIPHLKPLPKLKRVQIFSERRFKERDTTQMAQDLPGVKVILTRFEGGDGIIEKIANVNDWF